MQRLSRRAFTVLELIIVVAILGLLIALLLPAIQAARQAAQKNASRNNMKQLCLAFHNHIDAFKAMPSLYFTSQPEENNVDPKNQMNPANAGAQYSWIVKILPFVEEDNLYKQISTASKRFTEPSDKVTIPNPAGGAAIAPGLIEISTLKSVAVKEQVAVGTTHYIALPATRQPLLTQGTDKGTWGKIPPDGAIIPGRGGKGQSLARISDGTSRTVVFCESRESELSNWYNPLQTFACGFLPQDTIPVEADDFSKVYPFYDQADNEKWVFNPQAGDRTALNFGPTRQDPKQAYNTDAKDPLRRTWGPSGNSAKKDAIHGMGDGSVREFADGIDPAVYFAAITCRGGENVELP